MLYVKFLKNLIKYPFSIREIKMRIDLCNTFSKKDKNYTNSKDQKLIEVKKFIDQYNKYEPKVDYKSPFKKNIKQNLLNMIIKADELKATFSSDVKNQINIHKRDFKKNLSSQLSTSNLTGSLLKTMKSSSIHNNPSNVQMSLNNQSNMNKETAISQEEIKPKARKLEPFLRNRKKNIIDISNIDFKRFPNIDKGKDIEYLNNILNNKYAYEIITKKYEVVSLKNKIFRKSEYIDLKQLETLFLLNSDSSLSESSEDKNINRSLKHADIKLNSLINKLLKKVNVIDKIDFI